MFYFTTLIISLIEVVFFKTIIVVERLMPIHSQDCLFF